MNLLQKCQSTVCLTVCVIWLSRTDTSGPAMN